MSLRAAATAAVVASCAGGLLFVPGSLPHDHDRVGSPSQAGAAQAGSMNLPSPEESDFFSSARYLFIGLTLGLLVNLAGAAPARAVAASQYSVPDSLPDSAWKNWPKDVPLQCNWPKDCTILQAKAWGKAKATLWQLERLPGWDDKYSKSSTGAGVYRKYKMDLAWPSRGGLINNRADGTYDLPPDDDPKRYRPETLPKGPLAKRPYNYRDDGFDDFAPYKSRNHLTLSPLTPGPF